MDKNVPLVSIVMPCFNAEHHLALSVGSVQAQTFRSWELIAVDDGSTDATGELLANFAAEDGRIQKVSQPNQGVSAARNHGLTLARSAYVAFLDADDTWSVALLEKLVAAMQGCPDAVLAYCGWQNLGLEGGCGKPFVPPDYETSDKAETLFGGCRWPIHAAIAKRQAVLRAGGVRHFPEERRGLRTMVARWHIGAHRPRTGSIGLLPFSRRRPGIFEQGSRSVSSLAGPTALP